jgi:hypothetical protein
VDVEKKGGRGGWRILKGEIWGAEVFEIIVHVDE